MPDTVPNSEDVKQKFLSELKTLLLKYDAHIYAEDCYTGYAECGEDIRMKVEMSSQYDDNKNLIRPWTSIDLGCYVDGVVKEKEKGDEL